MVPRVGGVGMSFKGRFQYLMNDKGVKSENLDSRGERVGFVNTLNLHTDDPKQGLISMIHTANHAEDIKREAGERASTNRIKNTSYGYSLSWHISEDPSEQDMMDAVRSSLKWLKLDNRQALVIEHTDEAYKHVHILLNRVDPNRGVVEGEKFSNDHVKLSNWADNYERERGQNFCQERRENIEKRKQGEWVKYKDDGQHRQAKHQAQADFKNANFHRFNDEEKARFHKLVDLKKQVLKVRLAHLARTEKFKTQWKTHYQEKRDDQKQQWVQNKKNVRKLKDVLANKYGMYKANLYDQHGLVSRPFNYQAGQTNQQGKDGKTYSNPAPSKMIRERRAKLAKAQEAKKKKIVSEVNAQFKERFEELTQGRYKGKDKTLSKDFTGHANDNKPRIRGRFKTKAEEKKALKPSYQSAVNDHQSQKDTTANDNTKTETKARTRNRSKDRKPRKERTRSRERQP